jgi:iron complex outermembrane receptor protein
MKAGCAFPFRSVRLALLAGAALCGAGAQAQEAPATGPDPAAAPAAAAKDSGDIIVTAERRSEKLRDVPMSITALTPQTLTRAGVIDITSLNKVTPGLEVPMYFGFVQFAIRGISSTGAGLLDSSNVALYVDGVYQASEPGQLLDLPDVQQIEVLKGPQGTLYGQNAVGGAINVTTLAPSFTLKGKMTASYGNYNDKAFKGYVTGPLSDTIAVSLSGAYEQRDGINRDLVNGGHDDGLKTSLVRGKILYKPSDRVSFTASAYYSRHQDSAPFATAPYEGLSNGNALIDGYSLPVPKGHGRSFALSINPYAAYTNYGFDLHGQFTLGIGTINTVSAYYHLKEHSFQDPDQSAVNLGYEDFHLQNSNFVQEVNFASNPIGPLTIAAGLFYMHRKEAYDPQIFHLGYLSGVPTYAPNPSPDLADIGGFSFGKKDSYAGYLQATLKATDRLTLTVAGRYSYERQSYRTSDNAVPTEPILPLVNSPVSFRKFTPSANIRYAINPTSNVYASYSQGFKSGYLDGTNVDATPIKPEELTSYEVGYKGRLAPGIDLNLSAFHYIYKDIQIFVYNPAAGGSIYQNAASAHLTGVDFDGTLRLNRNFTVTAGAVWLPEAKYVSYPDAAVYGPGGGGSVVLINQCPAPATPCGYDASGKRMIRAPKVTGNLALNYEVETAAGLFNAYVSGHYNSGLKYDPAGVGVQRHYATLDSEISFEPASIKGLRIVLWGRNLTNKRYLDGILTSAFAIGAEYADPRTFGGRLEFSF